MPARRRWQGIVPPSRPLPPPLLLCHFVRNPLRCIPQSACEEPIVPYGIGGLRTARVTDPDLTEDVFQAANTAFPKPALDLRVFSDPLGQSLLTSQGDDWRRQRQAASGLFRHEDTPASVPALADRGARHRPAC